MVLGITLPALFLRPVAGAWSISLFYLLGVASLAVFVGRWASALAAVLSALAWNLFFLSPVAQVRITNAENAIVLGMYFVVAVVLGQLIHRIRAGEAAALKSAGRSSALYRLAHGLLGAGSLDQIVEVTVRHLESVFEASIAILLVDSSGKLSYHPHPASTYDIAGPEQPLAEWTFDNAQPAGKFTSKLSQSETLFVPLLAEERSIGVIVIKWRYVTGPAPEEVWLLDEWARDVAAALDRSRLRERYEQAEPGVTAGSM